MFGSQNVVPHLSARGTSVSRLARSAVVTLSEGQIKVSMDEGTQVKDRLIIINRGTHVLSGFASGSRGSTGTNGAL